MKKIIAIATITVLLLVVILLANKNKSESFDVMTSIYPVYTLTNELTAGTEISVGLILPPGSSPHTFEPSPSKTQNILESKKIFYIGEGLDDWALIENSSAKEIKLSSNIDLRETEHADHDHEHEKDHADHGHEEEHADENHSDEYLHKESSDTDHDDHEGHNHGPIDPHYWLSTKNALLIADTITEELITTFPESAEQIESNRQALGDRLDSLDRQITEILANLENRNLITLHEAWYYFAEDYNLNVVATFEPVAGREPTPKYLEELMEKLSEYNLKTIYSEAQLNTAPLEAFANDNNLVIAELDPLGGTEGRESYTDLMLYNAQTIANNQ